MNGWYSRGALCTAGTTRKSSPSAEQADDRHPAVRYAVAGLGGDQDLAVRLQSDRVTGVALAGHLDRLAPVAAEGGIRAAVGVPARDRDQATRVAGQH